MMLKRDKMKKTRADQWTNLLEVCRMKMAKREKAMTWDRKWVSVGGNE
jgi:hypothetical protein